MESTPTADAEAVTYLYDEANTTKEYYMTTENKIQKIENIHIGFEMKPQGYGVDSLTHEGKRPKEKTLRERAIITIKLVNDDTRYALQEPYVSQVYEAIWNHLEETGE